MASGLVVEESASAVEDEDIQAFATVIRLSLFVASDQCVVAVLSKKIVVSLATN